MDGEAGSWHRSSKQPGPSDSVEFDDGEAVDTEHPDWKRMTGMRDERIHEYSGVDLEIVWGAVRTELPQGIRWNRGRARGSGTSG